jgi:hypothetical protein
VQDEYASRRDAQDGRRLGPELKDHRPPVVSNGCRTVTMILAVSGLMPIRAHRAASCRARIVAPRVPTGRGVRKPGGYSSSKGRRCDPASSSSSSVPMS